MPNGTRFGVLAAASTLLLSACAGGSGASPSGSANPATAAASASALTQVLVWADPAFAPTVEKLGADYEASTGVNVYVVEKDLSKTLDDLPTLAPQGQGPDLLVGQSDWVGQLVDDGLLAPMDLAGQAPRFRSVSTQAFRYSDRDYGVPISTENLALFRNTALAPVPPQTIEEMATAGLKLKKAGDVDLPIALPVGPQGDAYHWYPFYSASGGYLFGQNQDGSYSAESLGIGEEGGIRAAQALAELTDEGALDPAVTSSDAVDAFTAGRAAFLVSGPWAVQPAKDAGIPLSVEPIPGFASTTRALTQALVTSEGFMLSAFAKQPAAAEEFLKSAIMTTPAMDALFAASGQVPAWSESYSSAAADPIIKGFGDFADASVPTPNLAVMGDVWVSLSRAEVDVMEGSAPTRTMKRAGSEVQAAIDAG
jgi:arabinogalactan oligomer/maltooligosaccharide transport system substrate-binding protein